MKGYYNMNDTIKIVYKNYRDKQNTMNVPLIKEEDTQLVCELPSIYLRYNGGFIRENY